MRKGITDISIFLIFTVFFGFLLLTGEPLYLGDSFQHEMQFVTREPVYALLIQFLRWLSPENHYELIIIVQNILAIVKKKLSGWVEWMQIRIQRC